MIVFSSRNDVSELTPDEILMAAYQAGNEAAFGELFERHAGSVYGFLVRRLGDPSRAEDLYLEAFLRLHRERQRLRWTKDTFSESEPLCQRRREETWRGLAGDVPWTRDRFHYQRSPFTLRDLRESCEALRLLLNRPGFVGGDPCGMGQLRQTQLLDRSATVDPVFEGPEVVDLVVAHLFQHPATQR
jgi:hypothetical protein